jgi:hypothetical protein
MSRREQIKMGAAEAAAFLAEERILTCATLGPRGWPHLMPLWYVLRKPPPGARDGDAGAAAAGEAGAGIPPGPQLWAWTYARSQKVRNLERDPRATVQVEAGELYQELRGAMLECEVVLHRDLQTVKALGREIFARYAAPRGQPPATELPAEVAQVVDSQASKRVALQFVELSRATWDHRKLGGIY